MNDRRRVLDVRATDDAKGIVVARVLTYNVVDDYGSVWLPGCLTRSLNQHLPIFQASHSLGVSETIGRAISWQDSAQGPVVTFRLDVHPDVPLARQVYAQLKSGTLTDVSIGFSRVPGGTRMPTSEDRKRWPGVTELFSDVDCYEVSQVPVGAVPGAEVLDVRHRGRGARGGTLTAPPTGRDRVREVAAEIRRKVPNAPRLAPHLTDAEMDEAISIGLGTYSGRGTGRPVFKRLSPRQASQRTLDVEIDTALDTYLGRRSR